MLHYQRTQYEWIFVIHICRIPVISDKIYGILRFIYILDSSNSSSFIFWSSKFTSSSRSNWTHLMLHAFSCKNYNKQILKWCWNDVEILLNKSFENDEQTRATKENTKRCRWNPPICIITLSWVCCSWIKSRMFCYLFSLSIKYEACNRSLHSVAATSVQQEKRIVFSSDCLGT